jgi:hypothetical protein
MIVMARQTGSVRFVLTACRKLTPLIAGVLAAGWRASHRQVSAKPSTT